MFYFYHGVCSNSYFEYNTFYNFYFMILLELISFGYYLHQW